VSSQQLDDGALQEDLTPEARRRAAQHRPQAFQQTIREKAGPGTRIFTLGKRILNGVYRDGFIHAGNLAYMTLLSLFPFFIAMSAIFSVVGEQAQREATVTALLSAMPPTVAKVLGPVALDVISARSGILLWVGGLVGLWTASSLVEAIRDILHRAYGTEPHRAFWQYRLLSIALTFAAVFLLLVSLAAQVILSTVQEVIAQAIPVFSDILKHVVVTKLLGGLMLFGSIYLLFYGLTPERYRARRYPKWPGALLVALWWLAVTAILPKVLSRFFAYDLTYGSLAGVMIALFFFWLVGLGMVVGAEMNAAVAVSPEEEDAGGGFDANEPDTAMTQEDEK
jgi:membrane protein